jgi:hypothetical protein
MAQIQDFLLTDEGDILIGSNGDFSVGESDQQHITDIFRSANGEYKEFPLLGCNIMSFLKGKINIQKVKNIIENQLKSDGYNTSGLIVDIDVSGNLIINTNGIKRI